MKKKQKTRFCYSPKLYSLAQKRILKKKDKKLSDISPAAPPELMAAAVLAYKLCNDFKSLKNELLLLQNIIFTAAKPEISTHTTCKKNSRHISI